MEANFEISALKKVRERLVEVSQGAGNTKLAYEADWKDFTAWCKSTDREAMPADGETVALYVTHLLAVGRKLATAERRVAAIAHFHRAAGVKPQREEAREVLAGARRAFGSQTEPKAALEVKDLRKMSRKLPKTAKGVRDRAVLVFGFASGLRRSELAALELADVKITRQGVRVLVRRSKTDQQGQGREIGIFPGQHEATCPVQALKQWLYVRGKWEGPLFCRISKSGAIRTEPVAASAVAKIVKRAAALVGLDPRKFGGHSLRAGCVTAAAQMGVPDAIIMQRTGHRSTATLARYVRPATVFSVDPLARTL